MNEEALRRRSAVSTASNLRPAQESPASAVDDAPRDTHAVHHHPNPSFDLSIRSQSPISVASSEVSILHGRQNLADSTPIIRSPIPRSYIEHSTVHETDIPVTNASSSTIINTAGTDYHHNLQLDQDSYGNNPVVSVQERAGSISSFNAPSIAPSIISSRDIMVSATGDHSHDLQQARFSQRTQSFASSIAPSHEAATDLSNVHAPRPQEQLYAPQAAQPNTCLPHTPISARSSISPAYPREQDNSASTLNSGVRNSSEQELPSRSVHLVSASRQSTIQQPTPYAFDSFTDTIVQNAPPTAPRVIGNEAPHAPEVTEPSDAHIHAQPIQPTGSTRYSPTEPLRFSNAQVNAPAAEFDDSSDYNTVTPIIEPVSRPFVNNIVPEEDDDMVSCPTFDNIGANFNSGGWNDYNFIPGVSYESSVLPQVPVDDGEDDFESSMSRMHLENHAAIPQFNQIPSPPQQFSHVPPQPTYAAPRTPIIPTPSPASSSNCDTRYSPSFVQQQLYAQSQQQQFQPQHFQNDRAPVYQMPLSPTESPSSPHSRLENSNLMAQFTQPSPIMQLQTPSPSSSRELALVSREPNHSPAEQDSALMVIPQTGVVSTQNLPEVREEPLPSSASTASTASESRPLATSTTQDSNISIMVTPSTSSSRFRRMSNKSTKSSTSRKSSIADSLTEPPASLSSPTLAPDDLNFEITDPKEFYDIGDRISGFIKYTPTADRSVKCVGVALILNELLMGKKYRARAVTLESCFVQPTTRQSLSFSQRGDVFTFPFDITIPELLPRNDLTSPIPLQQRLPPSFTFVSQSKGFPFVQVSYTIRAILESRQHIQQHQDLAKYASETMIDNSITIKLMPSYSPADRLSSNDSPGGVVRRIYKGTGTIANRGALRSSVVFGVEEIHILGLQHFALNRPGTQEGSGGLERRESVASSNSGSSSDALPNNNSTTSLAESPALNDLNVQSISNGKSLSVYILFFPDPQRSKIILPLLTNISVTLKFRLKVSTLWPFSAYPEADRNDEGVLEHTQTIIALDNVKHSRWSKLKPPAHLSPQTIIYGCTAVIPLTQLHELHTDARYKSSNHNLQIVPSFISAFAMREYEAEICVKCDPPKTVRVVVPVVVTANSAPRSHAPFAPHVI